LCAAITRLSEYLSTKAGPIDYARRRSLDYRTLLPDDRWAQICRSTGTHAGRRERDKALVARAYLYEKISGLPARQILTTTTTMSAYLLQKLVRWTCDFPRRMTPELAHALDTEAHRFLRIHCVNEPLTWSPPLALISDLDLAHPDPADIDMAALHHLAADRSLSTGQIAHRLNVTSEAVRHSLAEYPSVGAVKRSRARVCGGLTPEVLHDLMSRKITVTAIASEFEVPVTTVIRLAERHGIRQPRHRRPPPEADWLYQQYVLDRRTLSDIAAGAGVGEATVSTWIRQRRLTRRDNVIRRPHHVMDRRAALTLLGPWLMAGHPDHALQHFADALAYPTLQQAAQGLGLVHETLCYQIRSLERVFGAVLLLRSRSALSMRATPAGEQLAEAIYTVLDPCR
jgi:hypothetical protein